KFAASNMAPSTGHIRSIQHTGGHMRQFVGKVLHHVERQTEQNIRLGMNPEEARCAARKAFGGVEQAKERSRDARGVRWFKELWQDLRYGARMLRKHPGFTLTAVVTLALGIGAVAVVFSAALAALARPLPYRETGRLVWLTNKDASLGVKETFLNPSDIL